MQRERPVTCKAHSDQQHTGSAMKGQLHCCIGWSSQIMDDLSPEGCRGTPGAEQTRLAAHTSQVTKSERHSGSLYEVQD